MSLLKDMPLERANQIFRHPIHQDGIGTLERLITALRLCRSAGDFYDFQQDLLARVLKVRNIGQGVSASRSGSGRAKPCPPTPPS